MSDMTVLFKDEIKNYETYFYENFNSINVEDDDPFETDTCRHYVPSNPHKSYVGTFKSKTGKESVIQGEEEYLKNYPNLLTSCYLNRHLYVIEENEDKIALKVFTYRNHREVGKRYFKTRKTITYLTFNYKRKLFYSGEAQFKRKQKIGFINKINITNLNNTRIFPVLSKYNQGYGSGDKLFDIFLNRIIEKLGLNIESNKKPKEKYYEIILQNGKIKYPNAFLKFSEMFAPFKEVRKHDANLVTWLMKKHNLKGRKIKSLFNRHDNIDLNGIVQLYNLLGQDLFNKIKDEVFITEKIYSNYNPVCEGLPADIFLTKKEKENIAKILNTTDSETLLNSLNDHIQYKTTLKRYGEHVKITATNYDDYVKEHSEWSTLVQSYRSGTVKRFYGDEAYLIEKPIVSNGDIYYPVLLKTTEQYENESMVQSNCVRTYSEKPYCFIISLRKGSIDSDVRASIEFRYSDDDIRIVQKLGKYNKGLDQEWTSPIYDLELFGKFLYDKKMIKLPEMTKRFPNGKLIKQTAVFKNQDNVHNLYPVWDKNNDEETLFDNGFNLYEGLFMDLP
jgi:hypothetical protein